VRRILIAGGHIVAHIGLSVCLAAAGLIGFLVCILFWGGVINHYISAIEGAIRYSKIDLALPQSLGEILQGVILSLFISIGTSVFLLPFCMIARKVWKRRKSIAGDHGDHDKVYNFLIVILVSTFMSITLGGVLVLVVPSWIGALALVIGATVAVTATKEY
jgi:hypothetical protein